MEKPKRNLAFYCILAVNFYILPLLMRDTGSAMILMLYYSYYVRNKE